MTTFFKTYFFYLMSWFIKMVIEDNGTEWKWSLKIHSCVLFISRKAGERL
jgi:hypothetical protein